MSRMKMSLLALETYLKANDQSLFDSMNIPSEIDAGVLQNSILMRCGEFGVVYSDPEFMQTMINIWSNKWFDTFKKWAIALNKEYNPIENYDRNEESNRKNTGDVTTHNDGTTEDKVSAYNSDTYRENGKVITDADSKVTNDLNEHFTSRIHGNIGVTTSQQMLESEINLRLNNNIYNMISDIFCREFCIMVY